VCGMTATKVPGLLYKSSNDVCSQAVVTEVQVKSCRDMCLLPAA